MSAFRCEAVETGPNFRFRGLSVTLRGQVRTGDSSHKAKLCRHGERCIHHAPVLTTRRWLRSEEGDLIVVDSGEQILHAVPDRVDLEPCQAELDSVA